MMDNNIAAYLLASLAERIETGQLGAVTTPERDALSYALHILRGSVGSPPTGRTDFSGLAGVNVQLLDQQIEVPTVALPSDSIIPIEPPCSHKVKLVLTSLERESPTNPEVLMCLDFGTAMSKAFAVALPIEPMDLELGKAAGRSGYALPSSVFISNEGKVLFGFEAIEMSLELVESGRGRLDSIKEWLSLRSEGSLDDHASLLDEQINPTKHRLTQGDMIRIYLAFLTDTAIKSFGEWTVNDEPIGRYVRRRYARPCWSSAQFSWADQLMRALLAEAQILADTFSGQWAGGIDAGALKAALDDIKKLGELPHYLIAEGVPEPVAVAASVFSDSENLRDAFMVVDAGAGTTDFGLFVSTSSSQTNERLILQAPATIFGINQAGDKVDRMLRAFIIEKESIHASDTAGKLIIADLTRRIRPLKEILFKSNSLEYTLSDGTIGTITLDEFVDDANMKRFAKSLELGFLKSLESTDDTWLRWLAMDGVKLHVILTGGSSQLPMLKILGEGVINARGHLIQRELVASRPQWLDDTAPEFASLYPQLAVAIGGASEELPETLDAPLVFIGGRGKTSYQAGRLQISGN